MRREAVTRGAEDRLAGRTHFPETPASALRCQVRPRCGDAGGWSAIQKTIMSDLTANYPSLYGGIQEPYTLYSPKSSLKRPALAGWP